MAVTPALTTDEQTYLAGSTNLQRYLSPVVPETIATARINMGTFTYPLASLTVDGTSGGWSNIREGMTVYVGSAAGLRDRGIYRVRKAGNSTTVYIGEMSSQDAGLLAVDIRTSGIQNDDYVTVVSTYNLWSVLPRIDAATGLITEDYDLTVGSFNTTPPALVYIKVNGRSNHLFTKIRTATVAISATVTVVKWPTSSGSSLSYAWVAPSGWTSVSGTTTATLTATAAPGNYTLRCTVTDSIGGATERIIIVNIHHDTLNPPLLISEMPRSDSRDRTGRRMSHSLYNNRLASIISGSMAGYFEVGKWSGQDVPTATRQFAGWIQRYDFGTEDSLRDATIEMVGPAGLLNMMQIVSQSIEASATADTWQKVVPSLSSAAFLSWYMLKWRVANLLRLFDLTVFSVDPVGQRLRKWQMDKGSALQQIQQIMTERGNFGANSEGAFFALYHPSLMNYDDGSRDNVTVRAGIDASIYKSLNGSKDLPPKVQQVRGEGFSWDGSAEQATPYYSDAPKSPGQGSSQIKLPSQTVSGQAELEQLTGDRYAQANNPYSDINVTIERNWDVIEPAEMPFVELELPAKLSATGTAINVNTIPRSVTKRHNANGTSDITLALEVETHGIKGDFVPVPPPDDNTFGSGTAPEPLDPIPPPGLGDIGFPLPIVIFPTTPTSDNPPVTIGKAGVRIDRTANKVYWSPDYTIASPTEYDAKVPSWFTQIYQVTVDKGNPLSEAPSRGAYVIGTDGTDSRVAYTDDVYSLSPVWTLGATISGTYDMIESIKGKPGEIVIKGGVFTPGNCADDWVIGTGTEISRTANTITASSVFAGGNNRVSLSPAGYPPATAPSNLLRIIGINVTSGPPITGLVSYMLDGGSYPADVVTAFYTGQCVWYLDAVNGTGAYTAIFTFSDASGCGDCGGTVAASTVTSDDYGATLNTPVSLGTTALTSGMSVGDLGISIIAGNDAKASITNDHDGVGYRDADHGEATGTFPATLLIPTYRVGSTSLSNKGINPGYLMAFPALSDSNSLVKVVGVGRSDISPTVSGSKALAVSPYGLDAWKGKRVLYIGSVSGTRYIFVTKDTGASWSHATMANAVSIRALRYSKNGYQWLMACGSSGMKYSANGGVSWTSISVTGSADYAELLGT